MLPTGGYVMASNVEALCKDGTLESEVDLLWRLVDEHWRDGVHFEKVSPGWGGSIRGSRRGSSTTCSRCRWKCRSPGCCSCCRSCQHSPSPLCQSSCGRTRSFWWQRLWLDSRKVPGLHPSPSSKPRAHRLTICWPGKADAEGQITHISVCSMNRFTDFWRFCKGSKEWWRFLKGIMHNNSKVFSPDIPQGSTFLTHLFWSEYFYYIDGCTLHMIEV